MTLDLSHYQRQILNNMGIRVWQQRPADLAPPVEDLSQPQPNKVVTMDWDQLQQQVTNCQQCTLSTSRTKTVFGSGNQQADWLFIGEAPGADEDRQGEPFVGRAGQLLTAMIEALGLQRDQVYIANVLKCRPPENRDPMGTEVQSCNSYLHRQIALVEPRIIIALGKFAAQSLLQSSQPVSKMRGAVHRHGNNNIPLVVTYHPAYLLRSPVDKRKAWQDLCLASSTIDAGH